MDEKGRRKVMRRVIGLCATAGALLLAACGDRSAEWDAPQSVLFKGELRDAVVLIDNSLNRGLVITAGSDQNLDFAVVPLGKRIASATTSPDRERMFIVSQGDEVLLRPTDEGPALTVLEAGHPLQPRRYELPFALTALALDPTGRFAIVYAGDGAGGAFIKNPNELIVVDLAAAPSAGNPSRRSLPSHLGGSPKRLTFTPPLHLPAGDRRLLVVETDRDVMLLDLEHPDRPEVSVPVKDPRTDARALSPAGISVDPGRAGSSPRYPSIAVRTNADDNVIIYTLGPSGREPPDNDFGATPNAALVGGIPSDMAFVNTNQGPRLAVLAPAPTQTGFLIDVSNSATLSAKLAAGYQSLSPVAGFASDLETSGDQLLLWSTDGRVSSVAFWDLDKLPDVPSGSSIDTLKAVETITLNGTVASVVSTPGQNLKVVETTSRALYVLDPGQHQTRALDAVTNVELRYSRDGMRAWGFAPSQHDLAQIMLPGAEIAVVKVERPVADVVEIEAADGGKALLALHTYGNSLSTGNTAFVSGQTASIGVTVFDALSPSVLKSRSYSAVLLEGLAR
jgi:hypothetical protein